MCDTLVVVRPDRVLFAKNSDREPNEAQLLEWHPRRAYPAGSTVRCTWIEIPQVAETAATLISRPFWMWGAEMGTNEHGVTIGNEAVFTGQPYASVGLTGMDLLRLALERSRTARQAVDVICALLESHGQGGACSRSNPRFTYHNSFIAADPSGAWVLETAGRHWAVERVEGARTISNALSIPGFAREHGDKLKTWAGRGRRRQARTCALAGEATTPFDLIRALRDHGAPGSGPKFQWMSGALDAPCAHAGGIAVNAQTTASFVSELAPGGIRHWATATSTPCLGLFKPVRVDAPLELGAVPSERADQSFWWRHERLYRRLAQVPDALTRRVVSERDALEAAWRASPPEPWEAFDADLLHLERWSVLASAESVRDERPRVARWFWRGQDRAAGV